MRIRHHLLTQRCVSTFRRVVLAECDEELLVAGKAILRGSSLTCKRGTVSVIGGRDTCYVGDVFGQRLLAVDGKVRKRLVAVILGGQLGGGRFKVRKVGGRPPVAYAPFGVEGAAFRVKGVADFMADDRADRAIVRGGGGQRVEERRLEDGGREVQCVLQWKIYSVDRLRGHGPFVTVN